MINTLIINHLADSLTMCTERMRKRSPLNIESTITAYLVNINISPFLISDFYINAFRVLTRFEDDEKRS